MFQNDYRREIDGLRPSPAAVERLNRRLEEGAPARRPRRLGRRAAAALALCAALCVTAVAAGPTLWDALEARLGPYAPFAAEVEGDTSGQGLRLWTALWLQQTAGRGGRRPALPPGHGGSGPCRI